MRYLWQYFKEWAVRKTEPWREEQASLDLAWRTFAQKHNVAGHRPICTYDGWEKYLDPDAKAEVYEFPDGDPDAPPDILNRVYSKKEFGKDLNYVPGKVPR